jgi:Arc/MetJ-type ribon-helix-helix transcriptional regulator
VAELLAREGLRLLNERPDLRKARPEALRKEIAIGVEQADRESFTTAPTPHR